MAFRGFEIFSWLRDGYNLCLSPDFGDGVWADAAREEVLHPDLTIGAHVLAELHVHSIKSSRFAKFAGFHGAFEFILSEVIGLI